LSETDVEEFFAQCGTILKVKLPLDRETDRKRGYAYIDFQNESAVTEALKLSGREIGGRPVTVLAHNRDSYDTNRSASQSLPDYIGLNSPVNSTRALQFAETKRVEIDKDPDLWNYIPNISNPVWCGDLLVPLAELERIKVVICGVSEIATHLTFRNQRFQKGLVLTNRVTFLNVIFQKIPKILLNGVHRSQELCV
jgi:hypothetical protein